MKRGYAIRIGGDPEISCALAQGIRAGTIVPMTQAARAIRRVDLRRHTPEETAAMIETARITYGDRRAAPGWARGLLAGYGLICYGLALAYRRLSRITEGGHEL